MSNLNILGQCRHYYLVRFFFYFVSTAVVGIHDRGGYIHGSLDGVVVRDDEGDQGDVVGQRDYVPGQTDILKKFDQLQPQNRCNIGVKNQDGCTDSIVPPFF